MLILNWHLACSHPAEIIASSRSAKAAPKAHSGKEQQTAAKLSELPLGDSVDPFASFRAGMKLTEAFLSYRVRITELSASARPVLDDSSGG
jgi:hypothetical protein